jgi:DNA-binding FrmR family transcriptional regulator
MIHEHANHEHDHAGHDSAKADTRDDAIKRLSYIEGHLAGVKKMVEEDRYCVDILRQTFAVRRALQKLESQLIDGHLRTCVVDGVKQGREEQVLSELVELYEIADR